MKLRHQTALITGASSGIGKAIALLLAGNGANVVLAARRRGPLEEIEREINAGTAGKALAVVADITQEQEVRDLVQSAGREFGSVDILINNAGMGYFAPAVDMDMTEFDKVMQLNLRAAVFCTRQVLPTMIVRRSGIIINIISIAGKNGVARGSAYAASKFALRGFAESLFMEVREFDIRVVNLYPGSVNTEFFDHAHFPHPDAAKMLQPDDIAEAVLLAATLPPHATVLNLEIRPTNPR